VIAASLASIVIAVTADRTSLSTVAVTAGASPMAWRTICVWGDGLDTLSWPLCLLTGGTNGSVADEIREKSGRSSGFYGPAQQIGSPRHNPCGSRLESDTNCHTSPPCRYDWRCEADRFPKFWNRENSRGRGKRVESVMFPFFSSSMPPL
jgi:hypothetical protein